MKSPGHRMTAPLTTTTETSPDQDAGIDPNDPERAWSITDHVCRVCFSRILTSKIGNGNRLYRCTGCGLHDTGRTPAVICSCGIKLPRTTRDAGIRCVRNDAVTPETPFEIVARQVVT